MPDVVKHEALCQPERRALCPLLRPMVPKTILWINDAIGFTRVCRTCFEECLLVPESAAIRELSSCEAVEAIYRLNSCETRPAYDSASCQLEKRFGNSAASFSAISSSEALPSINSKVLRHRSPSSERWGI